VAIMCVPLSFDTAVEIIIYLMFQGFEKVKVFLAAGKWNFEFVGLVSGYNTDVKVRFVRDLKKS
jgi:hypothetical protein